MYLNMYKYILLCLCIFLSGALCNLNKEEGADCDWNGIKGKCVKETRCMTTLDKRGDKHPVCSEVADVKIICCTDCQLVNDTRNVVLPATMGVLWKDGTKARDHCLKYIDELPYKCREGGFYSGLSRDLDKEKQCHKYGLWGVGGAPPPGSTPGAEYPHQALLGFGENLESAKWVAGGSIISDKYILTAAHVNYGVGDNGPLKFVALDVKKRTDPPSTWQTHQIKRFIPHPDYKTRNSYNDVALIETDKTITFNKNVLPACLHVASAQDDHAIATTWRTLEGKSFHELAETIQTIELDKFSEEDCKAAYPPSRRLKDGIDYNTQMCYGSKVGSPSACRGLSGEPLLVDTQFSRCVYAIIGVTSFGTGGCGGPNSKPDVYTRVAPYKPWIESIVWA